MNDDDIWSEANDATDAVDSSDETARRRAREFDDALYASLTSSAHSDQARQLVETVTTLVAEQELAVGARTNKRKKKRDELRVAVERLLADLLQAQAIDKTHGYIYRPIRPEGFTRAHVGFRTFKRIVDALMQLKLMESFKGFQQWNAAFGATLPMRRKATRFRATPKLLDICSQHEVAFADFHQHFLIPLPENPLQLRAASIRSQYGDKIKGRQLRFKPTVLTERLEEQLKDLNAFLDEFELRGGTHRGYLRVFNNGNHPKFDWNMGGRLYSYGEGNYQQMEQADRLRMTINGEPVCEIDIRASYLTIFHALHDQQLDATRDPYDVPGLGPEARDVVKMWVTASFGNNAPISRWPQNRLRSIANELGAHLASATRHRRSARR